MIVNDLENKPLVSIIIPIYKVEGMLDRCVQSVVSQTYNNLEIILVDDGSPDRCPQMCDEWSKNDSRIRVVHRINGGLSAARNTGILHCSGSWIAFIDSDDWIEPDYIVTLLTLVINNDADLGICSFYDYRTPAHMVKALPSEVVSGKELFSQAVENDDWHYQVAWNKLYARHLCPSDLFAEGKLHEDVFAFHKVMFNANRVAVTNKALYHYMVNPNGIMKSRYSIRNLDRIEGMIERLEAAIGLSLYATFEPLVKATYYYHICEAASLLPLSDKRGFERLISLIHRYCAVAGNISEHLDSETNILVRRLESNPIRTLLPVIVRSLPGRIKRMFRGR
ncbi:glycosyltransferase [Bifidobacterium leontopitheci]|uniref:Glycosyltransferase n=1 Tax=Bifidobacterium leontopitheci TaxID=2650774 RepID=A0A6I1GIT7_9BIFI|nr:glycosyltransferase [Bifidobacterium leontopitheci]KAB7789546.1 glycosyltransferase [Bifidobacterium leontopitheci]